MSRWYRDVPHTPCPHIFTASPTVNIWHQSGTHVTINELTLTCYNPKSILNRRVHSWFYTFHGGTRKDYFGGPLWPAGKPSSAALTTTASNFGDSVTNSGHFTNFLIHLPACSVTSSNPLSALRSNTTLLSLNKLFPKSPVPQDTVTCSTAHPHHSLDIQFWCPPLQLLVSSSLSSHVL